MACESMVLTKRSAVEQQLRRVQMLLEDLDDIIAETRDIRKRIAGPPDLLAELDGLLEDGDGLADVLGTGDCGALDYLGALKNESGSGPERRGLPEEDAGNSRVAGAEHSGCARSRTPPRRNHRQDRLTACQRAKNKNKSQSASVLNHGLVGGRETRTTTLSRARASLCRSTPDTTAKKKWAL